VVWFAFMVFLKYAVQHVKICKSLLTVAVYFLCRNESEGCSCLARVTGCQQDVGTDESTSNEYENLSHVVAQLLPHTTVQVVIFYCFNVTAFEISNNCCTAYLHSSKNIYNNYYYCFVFLATLQTYSSFSQDKHLLQLWKPRSWIGKYTVI